MLKSRFFWRLYLGFAALVVVTSACIGVLVDQRMRRSTGAEIRERLLDHCALLEPLTTTPGRGDLQADLHHLGQETGLRLTLISPDGKVLADSDRRPEEMDNHRNRTEVLGALEHGLATTTRFSNTLGYPMVYAARVFPSVEAPQFVARVAMPLAEVELARREVSSNIVFGACVGILVALGLGLVVARRVHRPVAEMTLVAEAMREGRYGARVVDLPRDEIGILGETLNRLGEEITERMRRLRAEESRIRTIFSGMIEGVLAVDDEDRVLFGNATARRMLGLGSDALEGRPLWEVARIAGLGEIVDEARGGSAGVRREIVVPGAGNESILEALATPFTSEDAAGVVVVLHEITELRRLEQIRSDFVANVSHELKTPLTSIKGFVETLLGGAVNEPGVNERFLEKVRSNVDRLTYLVSDLLSLARIESQGREADRVPVDVQAVMREVRSRHEQAASQKGIALSIEPHASPIYVLADRESVTEILDNLLSNAVKYTPDGGSIRVWADVTSSAAQLHVEDTGIGIPPADLDRVFERFYRVDKARSRALGGTGLGLAIVKHLVKNLGGRIEVESEVGRGSRFHVSLPLAS